MQAESLGSPRDQRFIRMSPNLSQSERGVCSRMNGKALSLQERKRQVHPEAVAVPFELWPIFLTNEMITENP
jgi:hypothetical protein